MTDLRVAREPRNAFLGRNPLRRRTDRLPRGSGSGSSRAGRAGACAPRPAQRPVVAGASGGARVYDRHQEREQNESRRSRHLSFRSQAPESRRESRSHGFRPACNEPAPAGVYVPFVVTPGSRTSRPRLRGQDALDPGHLPRPETGGKWDVHSLRRRRLTRRRASSTGRPERPCPAPCVGHGSLRRHRAPRSSRRSPVRPDRRAPRCAHCRRSSPEYSVASRHRPRRRTRCRVSQSPRASPDSRRKIRDRTDVDSLQARASPFDQCLVGIWDAAIPRARLSTGTR